MSRQLFNKYGVASDEELLVVEKQIFNIVNDYVRQVSTEVELKDIRAVDQFLCSAVNIACCEAMLRVTMKMRKQERTQ
ncbi:MAG: hypothetical protein WDA42_04230 [Candidatus Bathyarchaeia archaeon]|jgi:hypothetical protein